MISIIKAKANEIRKKETNSLIVLKGFDEVTFKELSKEIEPAFSSEINSLKELLDNRKKMQKKIIVLDDNIYIARYEELLAIKNNLSLYEGKIFILENNLFSYYQYNFKDKEEITNFTIARNNEVIKEENLEYEYFYSDFILNNNEVYVKYRDIDYIQDIDDIEIKKIELFSYQKYIPREDEISQYTEGTEVYKYSATYPIKNEELKYEIINSKTKNSINILIDKETIKSSKFQYDLGSLKALCELYSIKINFYSKTKELKNSFRKEISEILLKYWKSKEFRNLNFYTNPDISLDKSSISQGQIIEEVIQEVENSKNMKEFNNIFITAPTGAGKSIFFQIPALYLAEKYNLVTIIISPLKALMEDQIKSLGEKGVKNACYLNSGLSFIERNARIEEIKRGEKSIVYLSPELLQTNSDISTIIGDREIGLVVIDEAHTVSSWGKNFRIDYLLIGNYVEKITQQKKYKFPIVALTATAILGGENDSVYEILKALKIDSRSIHIGEVRKDNIKFDIKEFIPEEGSYNFRKEEKVKERVSEKLAEDKKSIFYFPFAKQASQTYEVLPKDIKSNVACYTGKLADENRKVSQEEFKSNKRKIMLATKAFGMGIDIPDIENIYHYGLSGDLADYVQEIGRCARNKNATGVAEIDFNRRDLRYPKMLRNISSIKQWQMKLIIEKLFELYKLNRYKSTFLISIESFSHIFTEKDSDLEKKVKQALYFLEKDLHEKYTFPVVVARPKAFFSSLYVVINDNNVKDILTEENKRYFKKIMSRDENKRIRRVYSNYKAEEINIFDTGDIYEFSVAKYWEDKYDYLSYPMFIRELFLGKIFDPDHLSQRIRLKIELSKKSEEVFSEIEHYLNIILTALSNKKGCFTKSELEEELGKLLVGKSNLFIRKLTNIVLTYTFIGTAFGGKDNGEKFLRIVKDLEQEEDRYTLVRGNFSKFKSSIIRNFVEMFDKDGAEKEFIKYLSKDSKYLEVANLIQALELGTFEVTGGNTPKVFIRINEPAKLEALVKGNKYSNSFLSSIEKAGKKADSVLEDFFTNKRSNEERWDFIERYFLGKI